MLCSAHNINNPWFCCCVPIKWETAWFTCAPPESEKCRDMLLLLMSNYICSCWPTCVRKCFELKTQLKAAAAGTTPHPLLTTNPYPINSPSYPVLLGKVFSGLFVYNNWKGRILNVFYPKLLIMVCWVFLENNSFFQFIKVAIITLFGIYIIEAIVHVCKVTSTSLNGDATRWLWLDWIPGRRGSHSIVIC